ncbi:PSP1 domain-containing protein [Spirochaeta cellobiosiphila]|uniref:PSP1 domain-containing protein n=1 Tax=Spirochaeta cellobiosiphila TaxID=504483 RepID=UPI000412187B|nr:regulatory iron-sulfur-containing complex subunit RicT [Spirochaeta cellobiosiphila]
MPHDEIDTALLEERGTTKEKVKNTEIPEGPYYRIKVMHSSETEVVVLPDQMSLDPGCLVIAPTRYGRDLAKFLGMVKDPGDLTEQPVFTVIRRASIQDLKKWEQNEEREAEAFSICREKIFSHKLEMKLVSAHYLLDEAKVLFFFTAENRVDFRELVKDLVSIFKMRIELRQIGVRDEARVLGGVGVCGRVYCCHGITDHLKPVSIKMAKEQNLSLNSMKISGPCGRLLCCLSYEYDFYHNEKKRLPSEGSRISMGKNMVRVQDVNIFTKKIRVQLEDNRSYERPIKDFYYSNDKRRWSLRVFNPDDL